MFFCSMNMVFRVFAMLPKRSLSPIIFVFIESFGQFNLQDAILSLDLRVILWSRCCKVRVFCSAKS